MIEAVRDASDLRPGSHALGLFVTQEEAAKTAADFLAGSPEGQPASYWVADERLLPLYREAVGARAPTRVESVKVLDGPQVQRVGVELRPVEEVVEFVRSHPEGVTGAGETITWYWTSDELPAYLEYEEWFERQARSASRFLCPYNLRDIPAPDATEVLRALGERHSHVVLSSDPREATRVLQLFVFPNARDLPGTLRDDLTWAVDAGYVEVEETTSSLNLTESGQDLVVDWPA